MHFPFSNCQVKGLERVLGTLETQTQELMETSSGTAKYEHQHKVRTVECCTYMVQWRVQ